MRLPDCEHHLGGLLGRLRHAEARGSHLAERCAECLTVRAQVRAHMQPICRLRVRESRLAAGDVAKGVGAERLVSVAGYT